VVTKYKFNSIELKSIKNATILSLPFRQYHFIQYHFVRSPAEKVQAWRELAVTSLILCNQTQLFLFCCYLRAMALNSHWQSSKF